MSGSTSVHAQATSPTVLITGANRGLGFEFAKQYAARGWRVIATARQPSQAAALNALARENPAVEVVPLDVTDEVSVKALADRYAGRPIDVLLNNAGMYGDPREQQLGKVTAANWDRYLRNNALGTMLMAQAFAPHVKASQQKKIVAISSLAGSFAAKGGGEPGMYLYKAAKAALNMVMVTLSLDLAKDGVVVVSLSPGIVDTRNLGLKFPGVVEADKSIAGMIAVIDGLQPADSGRFIRWNGEAAAY